MLQYFIRIGALAEIRRASALIAFSRGSRVVVRSPRGVEIAEVLSTADSGQRPAEDASAFKILRPTTADDERLVERLGRYKREAMERCRNRIADAGSESILLDVDQLLNGGTLIMHFLGRPDSEAESIADEIATHYESVVRTHHLAELLDEGCGPDCGTGVSCGTGCDSCHNCQGCSH